MDAVKWLREWWPRLVAGLALATVAMAAGVVSYTHIDALTVALGGSRLAGHLVPVGVDGQIGVGSVVLLTATGRHARWGWPPIVLGMAESLFANYMSGISHGRLGATWAMVPALAFAVATFTLERWAKSQVTGAAGVASANTLSSDGEWDDEPAHVCPHYAGASVESAAVQAFLHARDCTDAPMSQRQLSVAFGLSRPKVAELVAPYLPDEREPSVNGVAAGAQ